MKEEDAIKSIEEHIIIDYDPTATLLNKFQKELAKLKKERKFDNTTKFMHRMQHHHDFMGS